MAKKFAGNIMKTFIKSGAKGMNYGKTGTQTPKTAPQAPKVTTPAPVTWQDFVVAPDTPQEITPEQTKAEKIQALIDGANGAEEMIKTSVFCKWIYHTDSVEFVCREAGAFWFLDVIVSYLPRLAKKGEKFQVWQMTVKKNREARVWCEDGNGKKLVAQIIPFTDFPLPEFKVFCEYGSVDGENPAYIIMLPGDR